ncbi:MAG: DUF503 domain-containing protein [Clostridiales bacterium]|nr:DUF503 domain-containing protein [Clostridiales bacterium]
MFVAICSIKIHIYESHSLKEKRHIVRSIVEKTKHKFNVSIAEIGYEDKWQLSKIGISCVSNSKKHLEKVIDRVVNIFENDERFEVLEIEIEI